jgi:hypothetical protein
MKILNSLVVGFTKNVLIVVNSAKCLKFIMEAIKEVMPIVTASGVRKK